MKFGAVACMALGVLVASAASAGLFIETVEKDTKSGKTSKTQRMWVQAGVARMETGKQVVLLKGDAFTMIDSAAKTYMVIDRAALKAMGAQMNDAMVRMKAQLASMPPEQRAMMEKMMGGQMPTAAAPMKVEVAKTGRSESVDGRSCRVWNLKLNGVLKQQHCVVPYSALPGKEDLQALFERMAALTEEMRASMPSAPFGEVGAESAAAKLDGYPVLTREFEKGKPTGVERRLTAWREEAVAGAKFEIPAGYKQRDFKTGMGAPR